MAEPGGDAYGYRAADALEGHSLPPPPGRGTSWPAATLRVVLAVRGRTVTPHLLLGLTHDGWCTQPETTQGVSDKTAFDFMELRKNTGFTQSEKLLHANICLGFFMVLQ